MTEQAKTTTTTQEHTFAAPAPYPPQPYNGGSLPPPPPGSYMPPLFTYPPPPDGSHPEGPNAAVPAPPYMMALPPGVVYAYPPHGQPPGFVPPPANAAAPLARPKRKQVKMACTNCANACKRCDDNRPCERCVKYGTAESCMDGVRKERKKGVKRGPYKRKSKDQTEGDNFNSPEWQNGQPSSPGTTAAAIHAATPYVPEGYYPIYYPPPGAFIPHGHEGQAGPEGSPSHANGQPLIPYFLHPGPYPAPFPHYPHMYQGPPPGTGPPQPGPASQPTTSAQASGEQPPQQLDIHPPTTINLADASRKADNPAQGAEGHVGETSIPPVVPTTSKKRSRTAKGNELRSKKAKSGGTRGDKSKGDEAVMHSALNAEVDGEKSA